jgi:hypothetical protein
MIYELRTYTLKQGSVPEVAKNSGTVGRDIRKDDYGKLEGYWVTEIGPLNQVMHLWSYKDLNERAQLRAELAKNPRWNSEYVPLIRPNLVRQDIRLLPRQARCGQAMARSLHRRSAGAREIFQDRGAVDHRSRATQRDLPPVGLR